MGDFELIAVNDGSTDNSLKILREYAELDTRVTVLNQSNAGQGAARNRAMDFARGQFLLFVDADDFIEHVTLQVTTDRAVEDCADLVHFDWKFIRQTPDHLGQFDYYNVETFWHERILVGAECEQLFRMHSYFSVTNLYRRSFLNEFNVRFEEGQIYEDNPFLAQVFTRAETVSLVHSPLYAIQANPNSSTKTGTSTDRHMRDHLAAVRKSFARVRPRDPYTLGHLADYHVEKFAVYFERRVPKKLRSEYAIEFVKILSTQQLVFGDLKRKSSWLTRACARIGVFHQVRPKALAALVSTKTIITPPSKVVLNSARQLNRRIRHPLVALTKALLKRNPGVVPGSILFLGFDGRFTGNSKALFEHLIADGRFRDQQVKFATSDDRVPSKYAVKPGSLAFLRFAQRAEFVVAESWIPDSVPKHPDSTWIQLWHGTPIKRMLFDSHEREITLARPKHKVNKYRDTQRWDLFLVDGELAMRRFETAFLLPKTKFIVGEYPRVTGMRNAEPQRDLPLGLWQAEDHQLEGGEPRKEKVALYAPTWRDRNYGQPPERMDSSYLLDLGTTLEWEGAPLHVLVKNHPYLSSGAVGEGPNLIDASGADIEELLLCADLVITDFSSVAYDAAELGLPVYFYQTDLEEFSNSRGIYSPMQLSTYRRVKGSETPLMQAHLQPSHAEETGVQKLISLFLASSAE